MRVTPLPSPVAAAAAATTLLFAAAAHGATTVHFGSVDVIGGPGDLDLEGDFAYAINFDAGGMGYTVNGVSFVPDTAPPAGATLVGPNDVTPWQTKPEFGATADDNALEEVFADIRWANTAPGMDQTLEAHLAVTPGAQYQLQILISGNHQEKRIWDIEIEGAQAVDEISSLGINTLGALDAGVSATYSQNIAIAYTHTLIAGDDTLDIRMGNLFGANDDGDRNPIWQGLTLEEVPEPSTYAALMAAVAVALAWVRRRRR